MSETVPAVRESRQRSRSPSSDWGLETRVEGDQVRKFLKTTSFCEGTFGDVNGFYYVVQLPEPEGVRDLMDEHVRNGYKFPMQGIFWAQGVELAVSYAVQQVGRKMTKSIGAIAPGSPAARDGRLRVGDRVVMASICCKPRGRGDIQTTQNAIVKNFIVYTMFRSYEASALGSASNDALLAPRFCAKVLENPEFADLVFEVGNEEILSYRMFVTARSPVLEAMLTHDMEEKTGRIKIKEFEPEVFRTLLAFMYSDRLELKENSIAFLAEVARAGDFFCIKGLKERALEMLYFWVTPETAVDILLLANKYGLGEEFTDRVLTFIALWSTRIESHRSFVSLKGHPNLLLRLVKAMSEANKADRQFVSELLKSLIVKKPTEAQ